MLKDVVTATPLGQYRVLLRFEDGVEGEVDLGPVLNFRGVFELLKDPDYFAQVKVDAASGTVTWPNGADVDPDVLYGIVAGHGIETLAPAVSGPLAG